MSVASGSTSRTHALHLPFLGLLDVDSVPLTQWQNKVLGPAKGTGGRRRGGPMSPVASLRRVGGGVGSNVASSVGAHARSLSPSRLQSPTNASPSRRQFYSPSGAGATDVPLGDDVINVDEMMGSGVGDDDRGVGSGGGASPVAPIDASRLNHMQAVQAKLDRSREAHSRAEEKRRAIHDAAKDATRGVRVLGVSDLEHLDKRTYLHPAADKRADLAERIQKHKQRGFTTYLSRVPFSTGAV